MDGGCGEVLSFYEVVDVNDPPFLAGECFANRLGSSISDTRYMDATSCHIWPDIAMIL